ncbi:unnamed protein product, partial [Agarophyton chilense]
VHAQTAAKPVVLEEEGAPLKEARSKKSKSRRKKRKSAGDSRDESSITEGFSSSTDDSDDSDTSNDDDSDDGHRKARSRKKNTSSWVFALEPYRSVCGSLTADEGGVTSRPRAVQYLLRSYATSNAIRQAILDLRDVTLKPEEGEVEYNSRLNKASVRCVNVHSTEDKITLYIDGLDPSINSLVARYREKHGRVFFLELVQFEKAERDAARARGSPRRSVAFGTSMVDSRDSSLAPKGSDSHEEAVHLMEYTDSSVPTVDLSHSESQDEEALMALEGRRPMYRPYTVPPQGFFKNEKPRWVDTRTAYRSQPMLTNRRNGLIWYSCYGKHHLSAECKLLAKNLSRIMTNYEALSEEKRSRVPAAMYWKAKRWFSQTPMRRTDKPVVQNAELLQPGTPVGRGAFEANQPVEPEN